MKSAAGLFLSLQFDCYQAFEYVDLMISKNALSVSVLHSRGISGRVLRLFAPVVDSMLSISKLRKMYGTGGFSGLSKEAFIERFMEVFSVSYSCNGRVTDKIPEKGKCVIVANHPFGGLEGLVLIHLLKKARPDFKILANSFLSIFKEIRDYFYFVNPLVSFARGNMAAVKQCMEWVKDDHLLVVFPAGKVSYYRKEKGYITDGEWNKTALMISRKVDAPVIPLHFSGRNSLLFYLLGRINYRLKLFMLPRELAKSQKKHVKIGIGGPLEASVVKGYKRGKANAFLRMCTYLQAPLGSESMNTAYADNVPVQIIPPVSPTLLSREIDKLDHKQLLLASGDYTVYYAYYDQIPQTVKEIGRLRELTFRKIDEGSGLACDNDEFDTTYTHLFIWDTRNSRIIGAYRMGESQRLYKAGSPAGFYLDQLYNYDETLLSKITPGLEMGRSFIIDEFQGSFLGLMLLWKGIGQFMGRYAKYRYLFGTVSLSSMYSAQSVSLMKAVLVENVMGIKSRDSGYSDPPSEVLDYIASYGINMKELSVIIRVLEHGQRDVPVLVKQYAKMGALFTGFSIDTNFNNTPGLFIVVDMMNAPERQRRKYLGGAHDDYMKYHKRIW